MKRNQTESNGMILRNHSESFGIITRNDRKNDRKRPEMTGNDRKRPQDLPSVLPLRGMDSSGIPRFSVHFPRKFPDFPRNSLIFSDFLRFSPIIFLTLQCFT